ncbi:MAG: ribosome-associated translation inhibitor RaiA [Rhizobiales bacterium]|nr:ribosome-associated translation inhibitor RaiA [Hyphomicrobiales bacterium]
MSLRISGKNIDIGDAFRAHADGRLAEALQKYFDGGFAGHVMLERDGSQFRTECVIHLDTGMVLRAEGRAQDAHQSLDKAVERIENRLRRYKGKLKDHRAQRRAEAEPAASYVIAAPGEDSEAVVEDSPAIIAEETTRLETLTVGGAVMAMDLADASVFVFRHAGHGGINVVYRRADGHIGWIDPSLANKDNAKR